MGYAEGTGQGWAGGYQEQHRGVRAVSRTILGVLHKGTHPPHAGEVVIVNGASVKPGGRLAGRELKACKSSPAPHPAPLAGISLFSNTETFLTGGAK